MMRKYKGRDRKMYLEGYAQGWKDGVVVGEGRNVSAMVARLPVLRYTDAPGVAYNPGGKQTSVAGPARIDDPEHKTVSGMGEMIKTMRRDVAQDYILAELAFLGVTPRHPTAAELLILSPRKPCDGESYCPVAPGCHICGLTKEEIAILNKP